MGPRGDERARQGAKRASRREVGVLPAVTVGPRDPASEKRQDRHEAHRGRRQDAVDHP
jgi:hypothetical protein